MSSALTMRIGAFLLVWFSALSAQAQLSLEPVVGSGLSLPVFLTHAPEDASRLFVVQQGGQIRVIENGALLTAPFLDITSRVLSGGERGLLGLAFHPDYAANGYFYVNYTRQTDGATVIARFTVTSDANIADADSEAILLTIAQPASNHNGGMIAFSPNDAYLYIGMGDGGSGNDPFGTTGNGQNPAALLGKMLRIDVDLRPGNTPGPGGNYAIPADNPFVGVSGTREEIWSLGLRNPWRWSFDRVTGDLYIADVGQNAREEVNYAPGTSDGGENYGWRIFEGDRCNTPTATQTDCDALAPFATAPVHTYVNPDDGRAVTGGYVYRGNGIPGMRGRYLFSDSSSSRFWSFKIIGGIAVDPLEHTSELVTSATPVGSVVSFGEDLAGELYVVDRSGRIYRLAGPAGEGEAEPALRFHTADQNADHRISLSEMLRIIQFFNSSGLHCETGTEDGYAPGTGDQSCAPHDSDYAPQDWTISLSEVLRGVQFFNLGGYYACPNLHPPTEDGFCVGPRP